MTREVRHNPFDIQATTSRTQTPRASSPHQPTGVAAFVTEKPKNACMASTTGIRTGPEALEAQKLPQIPQFNLHARHSLN